MEEDYILELKECIERHKIRIDELKKALENIVRYGCKDGKCINSAITSLEMRKIAKTVLNNVIRGL